MGKNGTDAVEAGQAVLTRGWKAPTPSPCDECGKAPAVRWFGDTSMALCTSDECWQANVRRWNENYSPEDDER